MSNDINKALKEAEWRGYTLKALEDMNSELKEIKEDQKDFQRELNIKIEKLNTRLTNVQIKVAGAASVLALIVSIVMRFVMK